MYINYNFLIKELPEEFRDQNDIIDYEYFINLSNMKVDSVLQGKYYDYELGKSVEIDKENPPLIVKSLTAAIQSKYISDFFVKGSRISSGGSISLYGLSVRYNGDVSNLKGYRDLFTERIDELLQIATNKKTPYIYQSEIEFSEDEIYTYLNGNVRYKRNSDWITL